MDRQPDSLGLHLPAFQFRREELSTDSSTHLKKSPLSSASERCSAGYRVQFQRLKCSIREVRASGPGFRSPSCCAQNPCREIVHREERRPPLQHGVSIGPVKRSPPWPGSASAMQSKARRTLCPAGRPGPSRAAGTWASLTSSSWLWLLILSQTSRVSGWRYRRPGARTWARQLGATRTRTCYISLSLGSSPIAMSRCLAVVPRTGWRMANRSCRRLLSCLTSPTICQAACGRDSEHAGLSLTVMTRPGVGSLPCLGTGPCWFYAFTGPSTLPLSGPVMLLARRTRVGLGSCRPFAMEKLHFYLS